MPSLQRLIGPEAQKNISWLGVGWVLSEHLGDEAKLVAG